MLPALKKPSNNWIAPAITTDSRKILNAPKSEIAANTMAVSPAAGPLTLRLELLSAPITIPPTIPAISPEKNGAPEASAMPKHKGTATKKTTILEGMSCFKFAITDFSIIQLKID